MLRQTAIGFPLVYPDERVRLDWNFASVMAGSQHLKLIEERPRAEFGQDELSRLRDCRMEPGLYIHNLKFVVNRQVAHLSAAFQGRWGKGWQLRNSAVVLKRFEPFAG